MGFYNKYILPKAIDWACRQKPTMRQREKIIPLASGHILEIGVGTGLNLPFYVKEKVQRLTAIEPAQDVWNERVVDTEKLGFEFEFILTPAEKIPVQENSFDTVVITYTLCTIPNLSQAFAEIQRVIKPNGQLLFCEHGKAPDKFVQKYQSFINPVWRPIGGGCNLNRDIPALIKNNGFEITNLETMYLPGWKPASFNYWGRAVLSGA
jgi:ubiquinone/menaquinone biosynthesis C-methylase UbiE